MNLDDMKKVSERYKQIKEAQDDINEMNRMAEHVLDSQSDAWVSVDIETDEKPSNWVSTMTYSINEPNTIGFSVKVPDTIVLEAIGILLRNKQQRIKQLINDNNI